MPPRAYYVRWHPILVHSERIRESGKWGKEEKKKMQGNKKKKTKRERVEKKKRKEKKKARIFFCPLLALN